MACHAARSTSLARICTHTSRPAPRMCRCRWGGQRGHSPPPAPLGTREAWPQRVGWLPCAKQTRPPTLGNLCRENLHTRTLRSLLHAVSTRGKQRISQEFRLSPRAGPSPANGSSTCSRRAPSNPKDGLDRERARRGLSALVHAPSHARIPAKRHDRLELTRWPDKHLTSCRLVQRLSRVWVASVGQVQMRHRHNESIALHGGIVI